VGLTRREARLREPLRRARVGPLRPIGHGYPCRAGPDSSAGQSDSLLKGRRRPSESGYFAFLEPWVAIPADRLPKADQGGFSPIWAGRKAPCPCCRLSRWSAYDLRGLLWEVGTIPWLPKGRAPGCGVTALRWGAPMNRSLVSPARRVIRIATLKSANTRRVCLSDPVPGGLVLEIPDIPANQWISHKCERAPGCGVTALRWGAPSQRGRERLGGDGGDEPRAGGYRAGLGRQELCRRPAAPFPGSDPAADRRDRAATWLQGARLSAAGRFSNRATSTPGCGGRASS
jgi:hypothetical protein